MRLNNRLMRWTTLPAGGRLMAVLGAALVIMLACNPDLLPLLPVVDALGLDEQELGRKSDRLKVRRASAAQSAAAAQSGKTPGKQRKAGSKTARTGVASAKARAKTRTRKRA